MGKDSNSTSLVSNLIIINNKKKTLRLMRGPISLWINGVEYGIFLQFAIQEIIILGPVNSLKLILPIQYKIKKLIVTT